MKAIRFCLLWVFFSHPAVSQQTFSYELTGEIKGLANDTLYLSVMSSFGKVAETIRIAAQQDKIKYTGNAIQPLVVWAQTSAGRTTNGNFTFFIEKGRIQIDGEKERLSLTRVTGTKANNDYTDIQQQKNSFIARIMPLQTALREAGDSSSAVYKEKKKQLTAIQDSLFSFQDEFVSGHPHSLASGMLLLLIADKLPVGRLEMFYTGLSDEVKKLSILSALEAKIDARKKNVIGSMAPGFTLNDIHGKPVQLADFAGKYVLLDFWASWCVPCRAENPLLKAAYEKYSRYGFEIIGISLDEYESWWKQAIEKDQLPWIHISDLKKPSAVAVLYGVQPIPDNFLIGPDGKIIERGLHGERLMQTLARLINTGNGKSIQ